MMHFYHGDLRLALSPTISTPHHVFIQYLAWRFDGFAVDIVPRWKRWGTSCSWCCIALTRDTSPLTKRRGHGMPCQPSWYLRSMNHWKQKGLVVRKPSGKNQHRQDFINKTRNSKCRPESCNWPTRVMLLVATRNMRYFHHSWSTKYSKYRSLIGQDLQAMFTSKLSQSGIQPSFQAERR
jgi:hypothetical protein